MIGSIALAIVCFVVAHHLRISGDTLLALLAAGLGLYFVIPSWPGAAYDLLEKALMSAPQEVTNLLGALVLVAVCVIGLRYVFSIGR